MEGKFLGVIPVASDIVQHRCTLSVFFLDSVCICSQPIISFFLYKNAGFDTASSIALLAISAIAKKGPDGKSIPSAHIVILPVKSHSLKLLRLGLTKRRTTASVHSRHDIDRFNGFHLDALLLLWVP